MDLRYIEVSLLLVATYTSALNFAVLLILSVLSDYRIFKIFKLLLFMTNHENLKLRV